MILQFAISGGSNAGSTPAGEKNKSEGETDWVVLCFASSVGEHLTKGMFAERMPASIFNLVVFLLVWEFLRTVCSMRETIVAV